MKLYCQIVTGSPTPVGVAEIVNYVCILCLSNAGAWTEEEGYSLYRERLVRLRDLYMGQLTHLRHSLRERRRQTTLEWQGEGGGRDQSEEGRGKERREGGREGGRDPRKGGRVGGNKSEVRRERRDIIANTVYLSSFNFSKMTSSCIAPDCQLWYNCFSSSAVLPSQGGSHEDAAYRCYRKRSGEEALIERKHKQRRVATSLDVYSRKDTRETNRAHYQHLARLQQQFGPAVPTHCITQGCEHLCLPFTNRCPRRIQLALVNMLIVKALVYMLILTHHCHYPFFSSV